ncbi:hypothetical protein [Vibrio quintilis]|uniref:Uncharacterized protein n=1 Tax=Vibrio quintilis TaxID=1117707 RepID=A0A1M7YYS7_9VIBR|nr:hypothetical protein [Vibrio quintilis]SHO57798.1 hypothetical protein VQ7734_03568 [Vibrio quintilis]
MGWSFKDVIGLFSWQWLLQHWYISGPIVGTFFLILVKTAPQRFLNLFGFKEIYEGGSDINGPRLKEKQINQLRSTLQSNPFLSAKNLTEQILAKIYDQKKLDIAGFNRALFIAFFYPIAFVVLTWVFSDNVFFFNRIELFTNTHLYMKWLFLIICILVAFFFLNISFIRGVFERQSCRFIAKRYN